MENTDPTIVKQCQVFKVPEENRLCFKDGINSQTNYLNALDAEIKQQKSSNDAGAIYNLSKDPGEQANLRNSQNHHWLKKVSADLSNWMKKELEGVPLPITSDNNEDQNYFYKSLVDSWETNDLIYEMQNMCQIPRKLFEYRTNFSYKQDIRWKKINYSQSTDCNLASAHTKHRGPDLFQYAIDQLNENHPRVKRLTEMTALLPEWIPWRISKNLPVYNQTILNPV
jgi:hypothetical protein